MSYDSLSITEIHRELSKLHDEFIYNIQQDRKLYRLNQISYRIDQLLHALTTKEEIIARPLREEKKEDSAGNT